MTFEYVRHPGVTTNAGEAFCFYNNGTVCQGTPAILTAVNVQLSSASPWERSVVAS
jgi:hypothetical protein